MTPQVMIITIVITVVVVLFTILNMIEFNSKLFQNSNQLEQNSTSNKQYSDQLEQISTSQMQSDHLERLARVYALNQRYVTVKSYH
jgi:biopolymer transport protein ExbB/TolQ